MAGPPSDLSGWLKLLAVENRIELLAQLQSPKTMDQVRLRPSPSQAGARPERPISRAAVQQHLAQLVEAGLVRVLPEAKGSRAKAFVLDHARLFALVEEVRSLGQLRGELQNPGLTLGQASVPSSSWSAGPKLILVHGVKEGRAFPLRAAALTEDRGWIIGRAATSAVCLDYDPYISHEHAEVSLAGAGFQVTALPEARNGTRLNWLPVPPGATVALAAGDVLGVGNSLLVFRED